jgi:hypothetical protein
MVHEAISIYDHSNDDSANPNAAITKGDRKMRNRSNVLNVISYCSERMVLFDW